MIDHSQVDPKVREACQEAAKRLVEDAELQGISDPSVMLACFLGECSAAFFETKQVLSPHDTHIALNTALISALGDIAHVANGIERGVN